MYARKCAASHSIDPATCEDFAHREALRFAVRFSWLNKIKFKSYIGQFVYTSLRRWIQSDRKGGKFARIRTNVDAGINKNAANDDGWVSPIIGAIPDRHDSKRTIDVNDTLRKAKDGLTETEWAMLWAYSQGEIRTRPEAILIKAQRLIQKCGNTKEL